MLPIAQFWQVHFPCEYHCNTYGDIAPLGTGIKSKKKKEKKRFNIQKLQLQRKLPKDGMYDPSKLELQKANGLFLSFWLG